MKKNKDIIMNITSGKYAVTTGIGNHKRITEEYYNFLVGEINRGVNFQRKEVTKITNNIYDTVSYFLSSD